MESNILFLFIFQFGGDEKKSLKELTRKDQSEEAELSQKYLSFFVMCKLLIEISFYHII